MANDSLFLPPLKTLPAWLKALYRPVLFASLGLHTLLLLLPIGGSEVKQEPRKIDEKPVKVTQLARSQPKTPPKNQPKPATQPKPVVRQAVLPQRTTPAPPPSIVVKSTPKPSPDSQPAPAQTNAPTPQQTGSPAPPSTTPAPAVTPPPANQAGTTTDPVTEAFAAPLGAIYKEVDAAGGTGATTKEYYWKQEIPSAPADFQDPMPFFEDVNTEKGKPGVVSYIYLSPVRDDAETFYGAQLATLYTANGFTIAKTGAYGGGPVYEVKRGTDARYFSIVPGGSRPPGSETFQQTGLIVVIWKQSPI